MLLFLHNFTHVESTLDFNKLSVKWTPFHIGYA